MNVLHAQIHTGEEDSVWTRTCWMLLDFKGFQEFLCVFRLSSILIRALIVVSGYRADPVVTSANPENERHDLKSEAYEHKRKTNTHVRHYGKSFLPQIPNREPRWDGWTATWRKTLCRSWTFNTVSLTSQGFQFITIKKEEDQETNISQNQKNSKKSVKSDLKARFILCTFVINSFV